MQVLAVVRHRPEVRKISFVAHSLGGLVARYAIGRLYEHSPILETAALTGNSLSEEHTNSMVQGHDQPHEAKIAGLEPMNFITFATPHLGSRGHKQAGSPCSYKLKGNLSTIIHICIHSYINTCDVTC